MLRDPKHPMSSGYYITDDVSQRILGCIYTLIKLNQTYFHIYSYR